MKRLDQFVYFVQSGSSGAIKIGVSTDPVRRLEALQTANLMPLTLLGMISGNYREEKRWHKQFQNLRVSGEWFHPAPELLTSIYEHLENPWEPLEG